MDYRKKYEEYYGIKISDEYEIHHMDLNHSNNDMSNLLLIPKKLHKKYHYLINGISCNVKNGLLSGVNVKVNIYCLNPYAPVLKELGEVLEEMNYWVAYKLKLENLRQNVINKENTSYGSHQSKQDKRLYGNEQLPL